MAEKGGRAKKKRGISFWASAVMRSFQVCTVDAHSGRAIGLIRMHACTLGAGEKRQLIHFYLPHSSTPAQRTCSSATARPLDTKNKSPPAIIYVKLNDFICSREITFWANSSKRDLSPSHIGEARKKLISARQV
jgi:hypothetical protein